MSYTKAGFRLFIAGGLCFLAHSAYSTIQCWTLLLLLLLSPPPLPLASLSPANPHPDGATSRRPAVWRKPPPLG